MPETRALSLLALSASLSLWPRICSICSEWMNTHDKTLCEAEISFSESRNPPHFRSRWEEKSSRPAWQLRTKPGGQETLQDQPEGLLYWFRIPRWIRSMVLRAPVCVRLGQLKLIWQTAACPVALYKLVLSIVVSLWFMWTRTTREDHTAFVLKLPKSYLRRAYSPIWKVLLRVVLMFQEVQMG